MKSYIWPSSSHYLSIIHALHMPYHLSIPRSPRPLHSMLTISKITHILHTHISFFTCTYPSNHTTKTPSFSISSCPLSTSSHSFHTHLRATLPIAEYSSGPCVSSPFIIHFIKDTHHLQLRTHLLSFHMRPSLGVPRVSFPVSLSFRQWLCYLCESRSPTNIQMDGQAVP